LDVDPPSNLLDLAPYSPLSALGRGFALISRTLPAISVSEAIYTGLPTQSRRATELFAGRGSLSSAMVFWHVPR
ncbi:hypothetical protein A2U01_0067308, partial [Trifolium medium]|nr:hypothetical protein [Trifolium medium]